MVERCGKIDAEWAYFVSAGYFFLEVSYIFVFWTRFGEPDAPNQVLAVRPVTRMMRYADMFVPALTCLTHLELSIQLMMLMYLNSHVKLTTDRKRRSAFTAGILYIDGTVASAREDTRVLSQSAATCNLK